MRWTALVLVVSLAGLGCRDPFGDGRAYEIRLVWDDPELANLDLHAMASPDLAFTEADYSPCNPTGSRSQWIALTDGSGGEYVNFVYGDSKSVWIGVHYNNTDGDAVPVDNVTLTLDDAPPQALPPEALVPGQAWLYEVQVGFTNYDWSRTEDWGFHAECIDGGGDSGA